MFFNVFYKSEKKTVFYVFFYLQINVFNIYDLHLPPHGAACEG